MTQGSLSAPPRHNTSDTSEAQGDTWTDVRPTSDHSEREQELFWPKSPDKAPNAVCASVARRGESGVTSDDGDPARGL